MAGQDDADSNWLYDAAYDNTRRPTPRTGNQAMHGIGYYNSQETTAVFEANKYYQFSVWAQGDSDATANTSRTWLYIFDGSIPFSEDNSLNFARYAPDTGDFANRVPESSTAASQANWTKITLGHTVPAGAPEIGKPVGVAFWTAADGAVDDASLTVDPAENFVLVMEVNTTTGVATLKNSTGEPINIDYYEIMSDNGNGDSLNQAGWNSLQDQNLPGFPAGNGTGNGWEEAGGSDNDTLSESYLTGNSVVVSGGSGIGLGAIFDTGDPQNLTFRYGVVSTDFDADFDNDRNVDGADFLDWQRGFPGTYSAADLANWEGEFGGPDGPGVLTTGIVRYVSSASAAVVPEPGSVLLVGMGLATLLVGRRRS